MIADALRAEIETFAAKRASEHLLYKLTEQGHIGHACVRSYLSSIHHLLMNTEPALRRATARADELGDETLAAHFRSKTREEHGHEQWARDDLSSLPRPSTSSEVPIMPAVRDIVAFADRIIEEDPSLFLSYAIFVEYFTVIQGAKWLLVLEDKCGIPRASLTVIAKHVEADQAHSEEAFDNVDDLVGNPAKLPRMRAVLLETMDRFDAFFSELAELQLREMSDERRHRELSIHVPAA